MPPIIIETPQAPVAPPPKRECLVLVDEGDIVSRNDEWGTQSLHVSPDAAVDFATPADLERAGFVSFAKSNAHADRVRADAMLFASRNAIDEYRKEGEARSDAIHRLARERDEARAERDNFRANYGDVCAELYDTRAERDAEVASRDALGRVLQRVERERDEARRERDAMFRERNELVDRGLEIQSILGAQHDEGTLSAAIRVVRERDEARAALSAAPAVEALDIARGRHEERARCEAWLRAVAEKSDEGSCVTESEWSGALRHAADRIERGDHAGTPAPALPRATDEELVGLFAAAASRRAAVAAVAARVRAEALPLREEREDYRRGDEQIRHALAPLLGLGETEESAEVMVTRYVERATREHYEVTRERDEALALIEATRQATGTAAKGADMPKAIADIVTNRKMVSELAWASDQELEAVARKAFPHRVNEDSEVSGEDLRRVALAVAARVRRERCLVAQAVEAGVGFWVDPPEKALPKTHPADVGTCCVGICGEGGSSMQVKPADVPKTLARLLGEVTRGQ